MHPSADLERVFDVAVNVWKVLFFFVCIFSAPQKADRVFAVPTRSGWARLPTGEDQRLVRAELSTLSLAVLVVTAWRADTVYTASSRVENSAQVSSC